MKKAHSVSQGLGSMRLMIYDGATSIVIGMTLLIYGVFS